MENTDWVTVYYPGVGLKPYLNKGAKVFVQGKMRTTSYKSQKDGNYHVGISINANIVEPFEWKKNEQSAQPAQPVTTAHEPVPIMAGDNPNDDLPF
ncbi:single-stranded DNA-binding protein [compost metagenome]